MSVGLGGGGHRRRGPRIGEDLRLALLGLIADMPRHGYDLICEIDDRTSGNYAPSPGFIFPTLTLLQDMGHVSAVATAGARKSYAITAEGLAHLADKQTEVTASLARLDAIGKMRDQIDHALVRRAVHNLDMALRDRLTRGGDGDLPHRLAALLDDVAQKIERT